jgi:hypothetical protein
VASPEDNLGRTAASGGALRGCCPYARPRIAAVFAHLSLSAKWSSVGPDWGSLLICVRVIRNSSEDEMIALFLLGELGSERFGRGIRSALDAASQTEALITAADLSDVDQNRARRAILAAARGYGENRDVFERFPARVRWVRAMLAPSELAGVRYIDYSYWNELSGGSRLASDAAQQIRHGIKVFGVSNKRFLRAARAVERGEHFQPLILVGLRKDCLICLEGHLRLTAYALAGFPSEVECLIGTARTMDRWDH